MIDKVTWHTVMQRAYYNFECYRNARDDFLNREIVYTEVIGKTIRSCKEKI